MTNPRLYFKYFCYPIICALLLLTMALGQCFAQENMFYVSDGKGSLQLFWQPVSEFFPENGWKLIRESDAKVIASWSPDSRKSELHRINPDKAISTEELIVEIPDIKTDQKKEMALGLLTLGGMVDFRIAVALGFGCNVDVDRGNHHYRLEMTNKQGETVKTLWKSGPVDSWKATAPVPSPVRLKGVSGERGIALFWETPANPPTPLSTYIIQRKSQNSDWVNVTKEPLLLSNDGGKSEENPVLTDIEAPLEIEIRYRVVASDIFGRQSSPGEITVFNPDHQALQPPPSLTAKGDINKVELSWKDPNNPFTTGYIIERTMSRADLYKPITPKQGLPKGTTTFKDTTVETGRNYYYRIRSFDPRGKLGSLSTTAAATVLAASAPPPPTELIATSNPIRIRLSWQVHQKTDIGGYFIEKKVTGSDKWTRLNAELCKINRYEDMFPTGTLGRYQYRIVSVGMDMQLSKPSREITVQLPGHPKIPRPHLQTVNGNNGIVTLNFGVTGKKELTDTFLIVRGNTVKDIGLIIDNPISGAETSFKDTMVRPGEDYWYGLIARDKDKNRSEMSDRLFVRVQPDEVPQADKPNCKYNREPFRHVTIHFVKPKNFLETAVLRKAETNDRWTTIADHIGGTDTVVDSDPPLSGSVSYAIHYMTNTGIAGMLSERETLTIAEGRSE